MGIYKTKLTRRVTRNGYFFFGLIGTLINYLQWVIGSFSSLNKDRPIRISRFDLALTTRFKFYLINI
jgi:hypothetical protein